MAQTSRFYKTKNNAYRTRRSDNNTGYEASGSELLDNSISSTVKNGLEDNSWDSCSATSWGKRIRDNHLRALNSRLNNNSFRFLFFKLKGAKKIIFFFSRGAFDGSQNSLREEQIAREIMASNERKRKLELDSFEDIQDEINTADFLSCSTNDNNRKTSEKKYKRQKMGIVIINKGGVIQFGNDKSRKNRSADSSSSSSSSSPEKQMMKKHVIEQQKFNNKMMEMMEQLQKQVQALSTGSKNNG
ncbi:unnamed protein product [Meloidogyne enterolobii]|uniref:Uncharacterized protein n=1 Tax=Meloidogyne enterolobii TaxID=390850 RepID=A0ACB1A9M1_MELEN